MTMRSYSIVSNTICAVVVVICISFSEKCDSQLILKKGAPHLKLDQGFYVGIIRHSRQENYYYEFLGLRYAKPPGRFEIATLPEAESGKKSEAIHAIKTPPMCPQLKAFSTDSPAGEEDCLFLNVYVPMRKSPYKDGFPVMVWFHGGGYLFGDGASAEPQFLMDEDVILVTINYRLGALGFLSTGDDVIPGNLGLKDQVLSLKWIQKNIKNFGGDNKRVTIFGCSAGSSSVQFMTLSPLAKGLFHNVIMQSGSAASFWAIDEKPVAISKAHDFSSKAGCPTTTSKEILECLKNKSVKELLEAQAKLYKWFGNPVVPFSPTIEAAGSSEMVFLEEHPLDLLKSKRFTKVPILTGIVAEEGLSLFSTAVMKSETHLNDLNTRFLEVAPIAFEYSKGFPKENLDEVSAAIREFYFKDKPINEETFQNLTNLYTDAYFTAGTWTNILEYATEKPVYAYVLSFVDESSNSLTDLVTHEKILEGAAHGDEMQYLFRNKALFPADIPQSPRAAEFSKRLVKLWASFAQHRKPNATWGSASKWPSISKAQLNGDKPFLWYELNEDTRILENPFMERISFWEKLIKKYSIRNKSNKIEL